ncbi:hypothetical protein GCM10027261_30270 [Geodermatophilus arenarius]|uniref:Membrane protein YfhO n=1 Tax=Geodermatophilus arenarius TaxID=1137990 RepID=A0ABV9LLT9_9ACTN
MSSRASVLDRPGTPPGSPESPGAGLRRPGSPARAGLVAAGLFVAAEAVLLLVVRLWQPRFFYIDDMQAQYLPVFSWFGRQPGTPPLIDPDQGSGGAFVADLQYGVLDPVHWLLAQVVGSAQDLNAAAWGMKILVVAVMGLGTTVLATHLGARPVWAAAAALGAVNSGFMLWYATSWWPSGWGTAWMPWLWWALSSRSRWAVPGAVVAAYMTITSGYPYALPFSAIVVACVALVRLQQPRAEGGVRDLVVRLAAGAGGALLGAPGLLTASALTPFSQRSLGGAGDAFGNAGEHIPNLLDVLLGSATLSPSVLGWWGDRMQPAVMALAWFVLPVLALVRWRVRPDGVRLWRTPGVLPAVALCVVAVVATQSPTVLFDLRYPWRYVVVLQVVSPVLVAVLASRCGLDLGRRRLALAAGLLVAQGVLAWSRTPVMWKWHAFVVFWGLVVLAVAGVLASRRAARDAEPAGDGGTPARARAGAVLAVLALVATAAAPLASIGAAITYQRIDARDHGAEPTGLPARGIYDTTVWPSLVSDFEEASQGVGLNATVLWWGEPGEDRGALRGAAVGNAALLAGIRPGYAYTSLGQAGWANRWCASFVGVVGDCPDPVDRLLAQVPGTDVTWLEALSKDVVLLDERAPAEIRAALDRSYERTGEDRGLLRYERREATPGRVTWVSDGVDSVEAIDVGFEQESYRVSWSGDDARVFTRIPWWPGYVARVDGQPVDVEVVDGTAVEVVLPAGGGEGTLEIAYERPRAGLGTVAVGAGAVLSVLALAAGLGATAGLERRLTRRRNPAG